MWGNHCSYPLIIWYPVSFSSGHFTRILHKWKRGKVIWNVCFLSAWSIKHKPLLRHSTNAQWRLSFPSDQKGFEGTGLTSIRFSWLIATNLSSSFRPKAAQPALLRHSVYFPWLCHWPSHFYDCDPLIIQFSFHDLGVIKTADTRRPTDWCSCPETDAQSKKHREATHRLWPRTSFHWLLCWLAKSRNSLSMNYNWTASGAAATPSLLQWNLAKERDIECIIALALYDLRALS